MPTFAGAQAVAGKKSRAAQAAADLHACGAVVLATTLHATTTYVALGVKEPQPAERYVA